MKISIIVTVFNEEATIGLLLNSILDQSFFPDEVVLVDGGSDDKTVSVCKSYLANFKIKGINFKLFIKKGNRSVGRNEAIKKSTADIILCTDAGCILDKDWTKVMAGSFNKKEVEVIAGYYRGKPESIFQKCLVPYVLVMSDKVDPIKFLPASRSMAFRKNIWSNVGGFPENLSHNEDYAFAHKLKKIGARVLFNKDAVVYWLPRKSIKDAFVMFYRFAYGDIEAGIIRPKAVLIFIRYLIGIFLIITYLIFKSYVLLFAVVLSLIIYLIWSVLKNYKYVNNLQAIFYLPLLQLVSDSAVLSGSSACLLRKVWDIRKTH